MKPIIVDGRYQLDRRLGGGSFGEVYLGHDLDSGEEVALKLEHIRHVYNSHLKNEIAIYNQLGGGKGVSQVYWHGTACDYRVMAFEILGPSITDLLNFCNEKFSLKTVLLLADQLISRFQYLHSKGYIHRDVKPDNMLMGMGTHGNTVYVTDLGLAKEIEEPPRPVDPLIRMRHSPRRCRLVGTRFWASISSHLGQEQSPRDDMECLGYILVYLLKGSLPWDGLGGKAKDEEKILELKQQAEEHGIFNGIPTEFKKYFELVRSDKKLDYGRLRRLFSGLFHRNHFQYDNVFDWTKLLFLEKLEAEQESSEAGQASAEEESR